MDAALERRPGSESPAGGPGVYIGLGSNLGDRIAHVRRGVRSMREAGIEVEKVSSLYETDPAGPAQPRYINAVSLVQTQLAPAQLLQVLKEIERAAGRVPRERWGPRELDLDILLYNDVTLQSQELTIPHRELTNRPFVLVPLLEVWPDAALPSGGRLAAFLPGEIHRVRRLEDQVL